MFKVMLESAANLCFMFWCFLSCSQLFTRRAKNTFEGAIMADLLQPDPLTAFTLTLLHSIYI